MWKQNKLGAYEQTPVKTGTKKQKNPIRSGWYSHPESGETVWYDSKTNQFRDKVGGPARDLLSIGYYHAGGKYIEPAKNLIGMTIKGAKKVVPPIYKTTKKTISDTVTSTGRALDRLLVTKTDPGFTNVKDTTGITKGKEKVKQDVINLGKNIEKSSIQPKKDTQTEGMSKKKKEKLIKNKLSGIGVD